MLTGISVLDDVIQNDLKKDYIIST